MIFQTDEQKQQHIVEVIKNFSGDFTTMERAIGFYQAGYLYGWKVLYLIHSKRTVRKYEEILEIRIREEFEENGELAERTPIWELARKASNFWKVVSGEEQIEKSKLIEPRGKGT